MNPTPLMHTYEVRYTRTVAVFRYTELGVIPKGLNEFLASNGPREVHIRDWDVMTRRKLKVPILFYFKDEEDYEINLGDWILVEDDDVEDPIDALSDEQFRKQFPDIVKKAEAQGLT